MIISVYVVQSDCLIVYILIFKKNNNTISESLCYLLLIVIIMLYTTNYILMDLPYVDFHSNTHSRIYTLRYI